MGLAGISVANADMLQEWMSSLFNYDTTPNDGTSTGSTGSSTNPKPSPTPQQKEKAIEKGIEDESKKDPTKGSKLKKAWGTFKQFIKDAAETDQWLAMSRGITGR
jgi:hypothetical protein